MESHAQSAYAGSAVPGELAAELTSWDVRTMSSDVSDSLDATPEDIAILWRFFRIHDSYALRKFGPPVDDSGRHLTDDDLPVMSLRMEIQYEVLRHWFAKYSVMGPSRANILCVRTRSGGLAIRSVASIIRFATSDLPAHDGGARATYSRAR